ncbi:MAG: ABC transporter ATP-binding protein/permease [Clostridiales bacterium]|nr:ABC transporter ATP-binding protein/permease [Clostridiales bacterium]
MRGEVERKQNKIGIAYVFKTCLNCAFLSAAGIILLALISSALPIANTMLLAQLIDEVLRALSESGPSYLPYRSLLMVVAAVFASHVIPHISSFLYSRLNAGLRSGFHAGLLEKTANLSYEHIEDSKALELLDRVFDKPSERMSSILRLVCAIGSNSIQLLNLCVLLLANLWHAAVIILLFSIPNIIISIRGGRKTYDAYKATSRDRMMYAYYEGIMTNRDAVEERTAFQFTESVNRRWRRLYRRVQKIDLNTRLRWDFKICGAGALTLIMAYAVILLLTGSAAAGSLNPGLYLSLSYAVLSLQSVIVWGISFSANQLSEKRVYLDDLASFFQLSAVAGGDGLNGRIIPLESIEFRNVSFRYPGGGADALRDVSFRIEKGGHYAFVGKNGCGKTTVTKLMTGLYANYEGSILINGVEVRDCPAEQINRLFSLVHQDFAKYQLTLFENVALGERELAQRKDAEARVQNILDKAGLGELAAEAGLHKRLGKLGGDGFDLSHGQWQKLAIARAIAKEAACYLLDEPASALDPVSESEAYRQHHELMAGKTAIFISHRLASTKLADCIFVLDQGAIIEAGSHEELLGRNGSYESMYQSQRSWYRGN